MHALGRLDRWHDPDASARSWRTTLCGLVDHTWCARLLRAPGAHRVEVRDGHPVDVLLAAAVRERASLLVVGSRGVGGNPALALGSTSPRVLQEACVPVLVVPERHGKPDGLRLRHLLVGVDGSAASLAALDAAADVAAMLGGSLSVLHVFEHVPSFPVAPRGDRGNEGDECVSDQALELLEAAPPTCSRGAWPAPSPTEHAAQPSSFPRPPGGPTWLPPPTTAPGNRRVRDGGPATTPLGVTPALGCHAGACTDTLAGP